MKQILHIFAKDTRRFRVETALSVAILFAFVLLYPNRWRIFQDRSEQQPYLVLVVALGTLLVASWWLLIGRVVHDEALVGDCQFWLTRPYEWKKLLAAKALFLACWIGVPYLLAQSLLLAEAGFHPAGYFAGLLAELLLASTIFLLPVWSVAAVTSNFARLTLTLLGGLALLTGYAFWVSVPRGYRASTPYHDPFLFPIVFCGFAATIALQYGTRRTWWARGLMVTTALVAALVVPTYHRQSLVEKAYAQSKAAAAPMTVTFAPSAKHPAEARIWDRKIYIDLPVRYSGVAEGYAAFADDYRFTIIAANGEQWTSPWEEMRARSLPGQQGGHLSLMLSPAVFDRFKSGPVTLRVEFAVSRYQAGSVTRMGFPAGDAAIPGIGRCTPGTDRYGLIHESPHLMCRSAIDEPSLTYATAIVSSVACNGSTDDTEGETGPVITTENAYWVSPEDINFGLSAVWTHFIYFLGKEGIDGPDLHGGRWHLCPGSPMTFTPYRLVDRTRTSLTIADFRFPELRQT